MAQADLWLRLIYGVQLFMGYSYLWGTAIYGVQL